MNQEYHFKFDSLEVHYFLHMKVHFIFWHFETLQYLMVTVPAYMASCVIGLVWGWIIMGLSPVIR